MEAGFWHQRWRDNLIGFHQDQVNAQLQTFWPRLGVTPGQQVFVPLCGKSRDMLWLSARHPVLGVELSSIAVEAFFREAGLTSRRGEEHGFAVCETDRLRLLCGDFFDLQARQLVATRGVYDRAALIALPPDMRQRYAARLTDLLPLEVAMLLVSLEYPQVEMNGPPFSVDEAEVHELFAADWAIERVQHQDQLPSEPRFRERGVSRLDEKIFLLRRRPG